MGVPACCQEPNRVPVCADRARRNKPDMLDRNTLLVREEHEARFSLLCTLISTKNLFVNADPSVGQVFPSCPKQMVELGVNVRFARAMRGSLATISSRHTARMEPCGEWSLSPMGAISDRAIGHMSNGSKSQAD